MDRKRQTTIRLLRVCAVTVGLAVLFLFDLHAVRREPPSIRIGDIKPFMNFSTARIEGLLLSDAKRLRGGAVYYLVADESGSLPVFLESGSPDELPRAGSRVAATGQLSVGSGNQIRLRVHDRAGVEVLEEEGPMQLRGRVAEVRVPSPGSNSPHKLLLSTPNGLWEVVHWFELGSPVAKGDMLEVEGIVGSYKGRLQSDG